MKGFIVVFLVFLCGVVSAYDCLFTDSNTGTIYDFSGLQSTNGYQIPDTEGGTFYLNLCDAVVDAPSKCSTAAICMVNGDHVYSLGDISSIVTQSIDNATAVIALQFENGDIDGAKDIARSAQINFVCGDTFGADPDDIQYLSRDAVNDIWYFQWSTSLVCAPENPPTDSSSSGSSVDPFFLALVIVVPFMCCVIVALSVCMCVCCTRRPRNCPRSSAPKDSSPLLPTTVTAAPTASAPEQPVQPAYVWAWNGNAYQAVPVMSTGGLQVQGEPYYQTTPQN